MKTKQITTDAILAALCAVLGYISIDAGNIKVTFESLPVLVAGLMFGPVDGLIVGGIGTLISQLLKYGVSSTTLLWMLPYLICGLFIGWYAKKRGFKLDRKQMMIGVVIAELLVSFFNTLALYIDSKVFGYYTFVYVFGSVPLRLAISVVKAVIFASLLPSLLKTLKGAVRS